MAYIAKIAKNHSFLLLFLRHRHHLVVVLLGWFVDGFVVEFSLILGSKINEKSIKNQLKKWSMTGWMLGWILDGSWIDFWWILGPSWEVSWGQVGTKIQENGIPKRCQKIIENLETQRWCRGLRKTWILAPKNTITTGPLGISLASLASWQAVVHQNTPHRALPGSLARWRI